MAPKAKSKNYSTKQQRITLVNSSSSSSSSISISSSSRSTSSAVITCVFIPIIQTEWQRSIWHPPLVWPPPGFDDDGEDMGMCGCWFYHETRLHTVHDIAVDIMDRIWRMKWHVRCVAIKVWTCMHVASLLISRLQACSVWPNIGEESPTWGMHPHFDIDRNYMEPACTSSYYSHSMHK